MKKLLVTLLAIMSFLPTLPLKADEGMWMLTDLKKQNEVFMRQLGLDLSVDEIYSPDNISLKDAVIHFGSGCTGEVISAEGLVITNHHCGYSAIQQQSSVEHDYLTDGFWARSKAEELLIRGLTITFIDKIMDVTDYVMEQLKKDPDPQGTNFLSPSYLQEVAKRFLNDEHITLGKGQSILLNAFYGGNRYYAFIQTTYSDIRMVGAPPSSIGKFGADTDNWMWTRHTGDFSLFRIYADAQGQPAAYSRDNQPLKVKKHLTISMSGYKEGDFTFVMGFPGRNWRYMISDEVEERMQTTNFMRHHIRDVRQNALMEEMLKDDAVRIHYASIYASSANYWKNAIGMNEGLIRLNILDVKRQQQEALLARGRQLGDNSYQQAFDQIKSIVQQRFRPLYDQQALQEAFVTAMPFTRIPSTATLVTALNKKDKVAIRAAADSLKTATQAYFENTLVFPEVERKVAKEVIRAYAEYVPANERIGAFGAIEKIFNGNTDAFIDAIFDQSIFTSPERFNKFIEKPKLKTIANDWLVLFRASINDGQLKTTMQMLEANQNYDAAHKVWVKGIMDMKQANGEPIFPDANSTLRLTYGQVKPYEPKDGVFYNYYTTLKGVMEKEDPNNYEFVVPARLKQLYEQKDYGRYALPNGEMPVNFLVCTDNTGGNSGSPVFNAKGQLIGVGFDRNFEGLTGDVAYRPATQRAICVDIRYILFIIDKFAGAQNILNELTIE